MIDNEELWELAAHFDKEARANEELAKEFDYDLELNTQYASSGRAYRDAARSLYYVLDDDD